MIEIFLGFALFASATTINKLVLFQLPPLFFVGARMITSGIILIIYHAFRSSRLRVCNLKNDIWGLLLISALTTFIPSILKAFALKNLNSSVATLIASLDPFVTALYAYFLWKETINWRQFVGMLIAFSGVVFLIVSTAPVHNPLTTFLWISLPECAAFISMVIGRYGWILAQQVLHAERYTPSELNALLMLCGGSYALISSAFLEHFSLSSFPQSWKFIGIFFYSVTIANIMGYNIFGWLLKKYPITFISLGGISVPLFVHLYGPFVLGESLSLSFFGALALVALGTVLFVRNTKKEKNITRI